jgi:hypothetical protein
MALKGWLDTGKCLLGFHQGNWALEAPNRCVLAQTCERCGAVSQRVEHMWLEWSYADAERCVLARRCSRCRETEQRTEHCWGAWAYRQNGSCEQGMECERCHALAEEKRIEHPWGVWEYSERYRAPLRSCQRCGLRASYFADQAAQQEEPSVDERDVALDNVHAAITDDKAIEELIARAERTNAASQPEPSAPEPSASDDTEWQRQGVAMLRQLYLSQIGTGQIASERQLLLTSILTELEDAVGKTAPSLADKQIKARRVQELIGRMRDALTNPSRSQPAQTPAAGSRLAALAELHKDLHRYVITETSGTMLTGEEGKAVMMLMGRLQQSREAVAALPPSADPVKLEVESLRQLALDIRGFSLRHHLTLARPVWPSRSVAQNPNALFYSGGSHIGDLLAPVCENLSLHRLVPQPHQEPASLRWDQLREAAVAVFDFTSYKRSTTLEEASVVSAVAYELGIALALGRAVVIVATEAQDLPFDLDIEPVRLHNGGDDANALSVALDQALYGLQRGGAGSSVEQSVAYLRGWFGAHADFHVRLSLDTLDTETVRDPIKTRLLIGSTLGFLGAEAPHILLPVWPGAYPDSEAPRCFHVTAFGPTWANAARQLVQDSCSTNTVYVRGDQALAPDILRSIWDEICRATHVVVDLTGLNANVALELGIAHALGRNVLLISQDQNPERYFRAVAKQRIHPYTLDNGTRTAALQETLRKFLG